MKFIFIINPKAGKGKHTELFKNKIAEIGKSINADFEIYITKSSGDAEDYVRERCRNSEVSTVFVACGGDGTLNEIVNGAYGCDNAIVSVLPLGTGNDFCKNFDNCDFSDIKSIFKGEISPCDIIQYTNIEKDKTITKYSINMFNIGFDCNVADTTARLKKYPLIKGPFAYFLSILIMLIRKKGTDIRLEIDNKTVHDGKLLLTSIANGKYCGGGIKSNPYAQIDDGFIDINIIKNVSRITFIKCLPKYMNGTIFDTDKYSNFAQTIQCKKINIIPNERLRICIDGEILNAEKLEFNIIPKGIMFLKPTSNNFYQYDTEHKITQQFI